ncbi:putative lipoprotein [Nautilia profundicola AmH]|uniref:Lipoprotein n=1 Tax=Nautilia profundicola (strain ATCC BAA-1463 / DSM 18972 / AmH) TaxID=598659 RepID=B9L9C6_NAUPA|nr:outer membrane protein assembly factor BamD [Nautilia profundicola]ACM93646.1 putative lipoprotein [Nautilia profundicola AmH]
MTKKTLLLLPLLFFIGCSSKNEVTHSENLTALSWHYKIYKDIQNTNLDQADEDFISLEAEHPASIYIKTDLLNLFLAHQQLKEYDLALFYLNEYEKRYASVQEIPWIEYQKIKMNYLKYSNPYTNQQMLLNLITMCDNYLKKYPNSNFSPEVSTILAKAELTNKYLDAKISNLYKKLDKPKASELYKVKIPNNSKPPVIPWYKKLFYW